jgi:hypothetical protein
MNQTSKENSMADAAWTKQPLYKPIIQAHDALKLDGYDDDRIYDAFLSVALTGAQAIHGPRLIGHRLYLLAAQFVAQADRGDATGGGVDASVH